MTKIVEAKCPGCKHVLRIPANWINQAMRCKQCGLIFQDKRSAAAAPRMSSVSQTPAPPRSFGPPKAIPIVAKRGRKSGSKLMKVAFFGTWLLGIAALVLAVYAVQMNPETTANNDGNAGQPNGNALVSLSVDPLRPPDRDIPATLPPDPPKPAPRVPTPPPPPPPNTTPPKVKPPVKPPVDPPVRPPVTPPVRPPVRPPVNPPQTNGLYPRRALAIDATQYVYANPIGSGVAGQSDVPGILNQMATTLRIPNQGPQKQTVLVSNLGMGAQPARKPVIEFAVSKFLSTCRAQDRIVILFAGHAVEVDDVPYLVPLDGELDRTDDGVAWDKGTLIPLTWLYDQLKACKAKQKVLILDVCRDDRGRGEERQGSSPMGEKLDAALKNPPPGVQVWTSCVAKQASYEIETGATSSSVFLMQLAQALRTANAGQPDDSIPIKALADTVGPATKAFVEGMGLKEAEQTPRLVGEEANNGATYDPSEPLPAAVDLDAIVNPGLVSSELLQNYYSEIDVPPLVLTKPRGGKLRVDALPPILARKMAAYSTDAAEDSALKKAVIKARKVLNENLPQAVYKDRYRALAQDNMFKNQVIDDQKKASAPLIPLQEALEELKKAGEDKDSEPSKRWQVHYEFLQARLMLQIAFLYEYQSLLGSARKDVPERDPKIHNGWRVASQKKMQGDKTGKDLAKDAYSILKKIEKEHEGTLWEVLAKQDRLTHLGVHWEAAKLPGR